MSAPQKTTPNTITAAIENLQKEAARVPDLERENAELRRRLDAIQQAAGGTPLRLVPDAPIAIATTDAEIRTAGAEALRAFLLQNGHFKKSNAQIGRMFGRAEPTIRRIIWEMVQAGEIKQRPAQIRRKRRPNGQARKAA